MNSTTDQSAPFLQATACPRVANCPGFEGCPGQGFIGEGRFAMMAQNLSANSLSSGLNHRSSSPYVTQDHMSSRRVPMISMPEIVEAFHQAHPSSVANPGSSTVRGTGNDMWELPELKWLGPAENALVTPSGNLHGVGRFTKPSLMSEKFPVDGEKWPFSALYAGDRVAAGGGAEDSLSQFSLRSVVNASTASSGSSVLIMKNSRAVSSLNNSTISTFTSSGDFAASSATHAPEWCSTNTPTGSSSGFDRKRLASERPDSNISQEKVVSIRAKACSKADHNLGSLPERLASDNEVSAMASTPFPAEKRKRQQAEVVSNRNNSSLQIAIMTGSDPETAAADKGTFSPTTNEQTVRHGQDNKKSATTSVSDHEIHIWTERERRKKMNGMFSTLHSLLPHLTSKADKSTIVDEAINYIQSLEVTMKGLLKRKSETSISSTTPIPSSLAVLPSKISSIGEVDDKLSPTLVRFCAEVKPAAVTAGSGNNSTPMPPGGLSSFQTLCSSNVVLNICGADVFVTICNPRGRPGLLSRILFVMKTHRLRVLNAHISTTHETILFMIHAQDAESKQLSNFEMLNIALQDLTNCLTTLQ